MRRRDFIAGLATTATLPVVARGQQPALPVVGFLFTQSLSTYPGGVPAFRLGLGEAGFAEGRNVAIEYQGAESRYDRLSAMAVRLVDRRVAVIAAIGTAAALAAKSATATIPIVFESGASPLALGLVASLNRPGGNITGVTFLAQAVTAKRLELLRELVPAATSIGYLVNPAGPATVDQIREAEVAARALGVRLVIQNASVPSEIEGAFANFAGGRIRALMVDASELFTSQRDQLVALAARYEMPTIYHVREIVEAGGLMTYGASVSDMFRLVGNYTGRILNGEKPADLPVQQSTKVELILNLKTAKALGITFPLKLLGRADEVIE